jgi:hypothetical protein
MRQKPMKIIPIWELPQKYVEAILHEEIETAEIQDTWEDDHEVCAAILLKLKGLNSIVVGIWWCGHKLIAAATYANSSDQAMSDLKAELIKMIRRF